MEVQKVANPNFAFFFLQSPAWLKGSVLNLCSNREFFVVVWQVGEPNKTHFTLPNSPFSEYKTTVITPFFMLKG